MSTGTVAWRSPSNIAIIKYWGKHGVQLPRNSSISFTLSTAFTDTRIEFGESNKPHISYLYDGKMNEAFAPRVIKFIHSLHGEIPILSGLDLRIDSVNSFPHSSGIASSASFMSSLALCLCEIEAQITGAELDMQKVSHIARLGSGSACRSIFPVLGLWGSHDGVEASSDLHAIAMADKAAEVYADYHNDILIVSSEKKSVSSTAGHALMDGHVYEAARYAQARSNMSQCLEALKSGDAHALGRILEEEALSLHGLMMNSSSSYILLKPKTLTAIERIKGYREETGHPLYFSLDAGPNLHLLYPASIREAVLPWRREHLDPLCERVLEDRVGEGPINLIS